MVFNDDEDDEDHWEFDHDHEFPTRSATQDRARLCAPLDSRSSCSACVCEAVLKTWFVNLETSNTS